MVCTRSKGQKKCHICHMASKSPSMRCNRGFLGGKSQKTVLPHLPHTPLHCTQSHILKTRFATFCHMGPAIIANGGWLYLGTMYNIGPSHGGVQTPLQNCNALQRPHGHRGCGPQRQRVRGFVGFVDPIPHRPLVAIDHDGPRFVPLNACKIHDQPHVLKSATNGHQPCHGRVMGCHAIRLGIARTRRHRHPSTHVGVDAPMFQPPTITNHARWGVIWHKS